MSNLGENREIAESKVLLLYFLNTVRLPLTNLQITKIMLQNGFINYFFLQQYIGELLKEGYITKIQEEASTMFQITEQGRRIMDMFKDLIPKGLIKRIDNSINDIRKDIRSETYIIADYVPENANTYLVKCKVKEDDFSLVDISITVGSKDDARKICRNWKSDAQALYTEILKKLLD